VKVCSADGLLTFFFAPNGKLLRKPKTPPLEPELPTASFAFLATFLSEANGVSLE
jgi:hypothetical protein